MNSLSRSLAACGLIALSCAAFADTSSVTVYGRIDTALESIKQGSARASHVSSSGSHIGFKGEEDLGQGLKAGFILEAPVASDTGATAESGSFFGNRSELYVAGHFGSLRAGSFLNPSYYAVADRASLHNEDYGITADALYAGVENQANRIAYASPNFHGLTLETAVSLHERANGNQGKNTYDMAANYERGDWSFGAGFSEWGDAQQYALRATWTQGDWTISGYHQRSENWDAANFEVATADGKRRVTRVAVAYAMGAGELHTNYGHANGPNAQAANQWTVGYNHHLSKRTKVYAFYTQVQNKNGASYFTGSADEDMKAVSIGLRHNF